MQDTDICFLIRKFQFDINEKLDCTDDNLPISFLLTLTQSLFNGENKSASTTSNNKVTKSITGFLRPSSNKESNFISGKQQKCRCMRIKRLIFYLSRFLVILYFIKIY